MKKLSLTFLCIATAMLGFSQENSRQLTDAQKAELRQNHNAGLNYSSKGKTSNGNVNFTSSTEQSKKDVQTTTVQYYYGKQDSVFKQFEYK